MTCGWDGLIGLPDLCGTKITIRTSNHSMGKIGRKWASWKNMLTAKVYAKGVLGIRPMRAIDTTRDRSNEVGARDTPFEKAKHDGKTRYVLIGDSFAEGFGAV